MVLTWVDYETFTSLLRNVVKINNVFFKRDIWNIRLPQSKINDCAVVL